MFVDCIAITLDLSVLHGHFLRHTHTDTDTDTQSTDSSVVNVLTLMHCIRQVVVKLL